MPERKSRPKRPTDPNQLAAMIVSEATGTPAPVPAETPKLAAKAKPEKNPAAVALGRLGGLKGGKARAAKLSPAKRKAIAKKAAAVRWERR